MILNEKTFNILAARCYDMVTSSSADEFYDDLKRFQYLKRLFKRYDEEGEMKTRLILNHLIVLYNCFGPYATNMLFFKLDEYHELLKPFVVLLNYMPEYIEYEEYRIPSSSIKMNEKVVNELRNIV